MVVTEKVFISGIPIPAQDVGTYTNRAGTWTCWNPIGLAESAYYRLVKEGERERLVYAPGGMAKLAAGSAGTTFTPKES